MKVKFCPRCDSPETVKSGFINEKQRYKCKKCNYFFTVNKIGKKLDNDKITKIIQLYMEGISYREIERLLGISHVTAMKLIKKHNVKRPETSGYQPTYKILSHSELISFINEKPNISNKGLIISTIGDKYMIIQWKKIG
ncbi:IS1 family transposase [Marinigracilibium pacificum]|uniref:IS1 family transposase n=1 Tax=Marinigracilibium pacificum TaxID=2729599 RepID=A0A848J471_9BACT|nr:IS1 family transposase [Marinigracilibium pacificum]NMM47972.1 IS1 family transposase [Marinigracilibium pacificum]